MTAAYIIIILLIVAILIILLFYKYALQKMMKITGAKQERKIQMLNDALYIKDSEIKRLQYILEKNKIEQRNTQIPTSAPNDNESVKWEKDQILKEKNELQREKEQIQQRNKALWDQSIAIHKEKERIDNLRKQIERKHTEVTDSIRYAERIQRTLLAQDNTINQIFKEFFILFMPRNIVSGDFYWAHFQNNKIILVVADCTGHGVPGAFMSVLGISLLNDLVLQDKCDNPAEMLEQMRAKLKAALGQTGKPGEPKDGMDLALIMYNSDSHNLNFAGAYNPFWLFRQNPENENEPIFIELKADNQPVGVHFQEVPFTNQSIQLLSGDVFYLFSDGYYSQFGGPNNRKIKKVGLREKINQIYLSDMQEQKESLAQFFDEWKSEWVQTDDVLVMGVKIP